MHLSAEKRGCIYGAFGKRYCKLGVSARQQIAEEQNKRKLEEIRKEQIQKPLSDFESNLERDYYWGTIYPKLQSGMIVNCELHKVFPLYPKEDYCGVRLPKAQYTPDFFITYKNGHQEAVEVKHKKIRKLQRDYIYRRRLFIEMWAKPNGWGFIEIIQGE